MTTRRQISTRYSWMRLEPLSLNDWLVIDTEQAALTGDGVIGHIQYLFGLYEVLSRREPTGRAYFESLNFAVDSFATESQAAESQLTTT